MRLLPLRITLGVIAFFHIPLAILFLAGLDFRSRVRVPSGWYTWTSTA
ncbi:MAG: hypothetical protein ACOH1J_04395 [Microbacteriaceae bacterium]